MPTPADIDASTPFGALVRARRADDGVALRVDDLSITYREYVAGATMRARWLVGQLGPPRPRHVGVLLENVPEVPLLIGACALAGLTYVALNPTRGPAELARDVAHTDCAFVITESVHRPLLADLDRDTMVVEIDDCGWAETQAASLLEGDDLTAALDTLAADADPTAPLLLIFTSGTTGSPKAAKVGQRRLATITSEAGTGLGLGPGKVAYVSMPLFHSNAIFAGWGPALATGAACALRPRFSASHFLPDVRRYGATYFNYVGKPLSYILATPEQPDDADNPLVLVLGNEATVPDIKAFSQRFGCYVVDNYGSTEGGITVIRTPETPDGALGLPKGEGVVVLDPTTGRECPRARFDDGGRLLNAEACVGELASTTSASTFEGYWDNPEADAERVHDGIYWSGDLAYRDDAGFLWFAGRTDSWLRVDGENLAVAPIEHVLLRHPDVVVAAVYAVPDERVGDAVMAALVLRPDTTFDPDAFGPFLARQRDLHTKGAPRYVRVADELPMTPTNKVLVRELRRQGLDCPDPVWVRATDGRYERR